MGLTSCISGLALKFGFFGSKRPLCCFFLSLSGVKVPVPLCVFAFR